MVYIIQQLILSTTSIICKVEEDDIDKQLAKLDGKIARKRNPKVFDCIILLFKYDKLSQTVYLILLIILIIIQYIYNYFRCKHNDKSKCFHCTSLEVC